LTGWSWENYNSTWQLKGDSSRDGTYLSIISSATHDLTYYSKINVNLWLSHSPNSNSTVKIYVCTTTTSCTQITSQKYTSTTTQQYSKSLVGDVTNYKGNYYIKVTCDQTSRPWHQTNVGGVFLTN